MNAKIDRRALIQPVLDAEVERWSRKTCDELASELKEEENYQIEFESKRYQVEVQLLEDTAEYIHVMVAVDDGTWRAALRSPARTFIRSRNPS